MEKGASEEGFIEEGRRITEEVPATIPDSFIVACAIKCTKIQEKGRAGAGRMMQQSIDKRALRNVYATRRDLQVLLR